MGFDHRNSTGLGEPETPLLRGVDKVLCPSDPGEKKQSPRKRLDPTYLLISESLLWRQGAAVAHCRDKDTGSGSSWEYLLE